MRSIRANFDKAAKEEMWQRSGGKCEICSQPFNGRSPHYHHTPVPAALLDRKATANDGKCICPPCHKIETRRETVPLVAKAKRLEAKRAGTKARSSVKIPSRPFQRTPIDPGPIGSKGQRQHEENMRKAGKPIVRAWFLK